MKVKNFARKMPKIKKSARKDAQNVICGILFILGQTLGQYITEGKHSCINNEKMESVG